ncbi:zinc-ribbon domain-containing protein [Nonomuraea sp. NPDC051941]|uniref:zinc-ribbon domain-containing protein n=1 Tax=Nonomuraea sp. NPDC051941 TaxID=3364373 RepID=UPI0037CB27E4
MLPLVRDQDEDADRSELWARLQREFVSNLSNPGLHLEEMRPSSKDRCLWRCSKAGCGHEWQTILQFRARRTNPTGCPECWRKRNRVPGPGESLAVVNPELAKQFRRNLTRPERGPDTLLPQAHDKCEWECERGHLNPATVANRTNGRGCPDCSGQGRTFFECKVAALVEAASGLTVELDHRLHLPGRRKDRFDLFLPKLDLLIDLDPAWTHRGADSLARDTAKTEAAMLAGLELVRIRERGLPPLPISGLSHYEAGPGVDPEEWAAAIGYVLRRRGEPWKDLDAAQVTAALTRASALWHEVVAGPKISALDVAPHLADEFVANRTSPGRGLERMPPGCNDVCAWRCSTPNCGHEWEVALSVRTLMGRGCQECGWRKTGAANSRPGPGESLAEVNPELAAQLVEVVDHPGWTAPDLLPNSNKPCIWRCPDPDCRYEWTAPPGRRTNQGSGCSECARKRTAAARVRPKPGQSLQDLFPQIAAELVEVIGQPRLTAADLRAGSNMKCRWRCAKPGCSRSWLATPGQRTRRGGTGKPCPRCHPRRGQQ